MDTCAGSTKGEGDVCKGMLMGPIYISPCSKKN